MDFDRISNRALGGAVILLGCRSLTALRVDRVDKVRQGEYLPSDNKLRGTSKTQAYYET